ncbi:MAG: glycosyltransferase family 2 protein [Methyloprofundus sp.]|nr:glycosyltransferase family 2 protein [Methyloprofundus sp.]
MSANANILIIIVTWNKKDYVIELLNSLSALSFPRQQLDILLVDNASSDGTVEALEAQFQDIQIIRNSENLGGTGGFNTGLAFAFAQEEARYDYLWLLDNDVVVHKNALTELVALLDANPDVAIAGSTMMQLDFPWRINEMGAFVDKGCGRLIFNRHLEDIDSWQGTSVGDLRHRDIDLSQQLSACQPCMDVDYVAAASLLIRAPVARQAGLWMDFFIHFDDVEWCLRIANAGQRIVVSAKSLIWHLSAVAKVPSWILYYDNRNILYLLQQHSDAHAIRNSLRWSIKKALYYHLLGKHDLAALHVQAIEDYQRGIMGKKDLQLPYQSEDIANISTILADATVNSILIPWPVNLQSSGVQTLIVKAMKRRSDLRVFYLTPPPLIKKALVCQLPGAIPLFLPTSSLLRYWRYFKLRNQFDLVFQSDYQPILPLSWLADKIVFINNENS